MISMGSPYDQYRLGGDRDAISAAAKRDHYSAGGRTIAWGPYAGVGRDNPNRAPNLRPFAMSQE
jgi:hypothetical protein